MRTIPIIPMPQLSDAAWDRLTRETAEDPEDAIERILRENQIDMLEVLTYAQSA